MTKLGTAKMKIFLHNTLYKTLALQIGPVLNSIRKGCHLFQIAGLV